MEWQNHKAELDSIFFRDRDFIKRGTKNYDDFWAFFKKYQAFQSRKQSTTSTSSKASDSREKSCKLGLPMKYDKRYKINVSVKSKDFEHYSRPYSVTGNRDDDKLSKEKLSEFRLALLHYVDFCQKQQFNKLAKLRKDQANLPIAKYKDKILNAVKANQVIVIAGDTGCGKSTQVPQYLLAAGYTNIACTQPRRIACISLAKRVGYETLNEYGSEVAYKIRFESTKNIFTRILFVTEGLLLRQISSDSTLSQYNVIIVDEVHERHIHTDFLLGVLRCLLEHRKDLKLILMSATININLFSGYFSDAPVIQVPGRLYPIKLEYVAVSPEEQTSRSERLDPRPYLRIMQRVDNKYPSNERGDLLIFLSGMSEISSVTEAARHYATQTKRWIVLPLHSTLSVHEQDKVFDIAPDGVRKCIIATNIAETSVTIDGVRFIADSGKVKEMSYDPKAKMQRLQEFWISRASAEQRKGRAGRTGPGVCFRLYEESDYNDFQEYATPEIHRVPLDSLILQMIAMGLPNARSFPFIEPPPLSSIENSIVFLKEQGALTEDEKLTPIGKMLAQLPVDVVIGKMLIMGTVFHVIHPVLSISASLSVQSPFTNKAYHDHNIASARQPLESDHGDPFTLLNSYDEWIQVKTQGRNSSRKWCKRRGLEEQRFYEMSKLRQQFKDLLKDHGLLTLAGEDRQYSSVERHYRNREKEKLKKLKREQRQANRKRKVLKLEQEDFEVSDASDNEGVDIADIDFKLTHDIDDLQEMSDVSRGFTLREINLLKVILCSGLYPQLAIADDCNSYRKDSDQVFHTKSKPFVVLHPTGVFANNPDILEPRITNQNEMDKTRMNFSNKHELLAFVSLLETNKPYLVNTMRVPAIQTMMLYSHSLDTNQECTRIVADGWIDFQFKDGESAQYLLSSAVQLRSTWQKLLQIKLEDSMSADKTKPDSGPNLNVLRLERILAAKLSELLDSDVQYSMRKLRSTEAAHLYVGPNKDMGTTGEVDKFFHSQSSNCEPHPTKGGTRVNTYLTFGCLIDNETADMDEYGSVMRKHWICPICNSNMIVTVLEKIQHESQCTGEIEIKQSDTDQTQTSSTSKDGQMRHLKKTYHCDVCEQDLQLTTTEILKHKRSHKN
ncbi:putative ATP-dependent RNA helicase DHX34 [Glandiceps talaboti]